MALAVILSVILIDQAVKVAVKTTMPLHEHIAVTSWFQIFFTENEGMAFGMDFVGTMVLTLFRVVAIGFFIYYL
ncbi:MAG: signal peptidase II, partial [Bacteroidaceae bacterium]|nr:signal peptidase II [Bacteroidaceae bacterium]